MIFESSLPIVALIASILIAVSISLPIFYHGKHVILPDGELYHDQDGTATPQAQSTFVRVHRVYVTATLILNILGLLVNISAAILMRDNLSSFPIRIQLLEISLKISAAVSKFSLQEYSAF